MQPTDQNTITRRPLDVEDYVDAAIRHKAWILGPFLLGLVGTVAGVYLWPDTYVSTAIVKIVPQQVPPNMVQSAIMQDLTDRINSMGQTIESHTNLLNIINTYNLYPRDRKSRPDVDVIEDMKKKIDISPVAPITTANGPRALPAFAVSFTYNDRYLAQKVVQDLVSRFIEENQRNRSRQTFETTQFLKDAADAAKKELDDVGSKMTDFRVQFNGRLPDQVDANYRQIQTLQGNMGITTANLARAQQEKIYIESQLRIMRDQYNLIAKTPAQIAAQQVTTDRFASIDADIQALDNNLLVLRQRYKDSYPEVQAVLERKAAALKRRDEILRGQTTTTPVDPSEVSPTVVSAVPVNQQALRDARDYELRIAQAEASMEAKDVEIEGIQKELKRTNDQIRSLQAKVEAAPAGERQYVELTSQQTFARSKYQTMQENLAKAQLSADMEGRKQGETLELLDPASLPGTPTEPKRAQIIGIGAAAGLLLGLVLAFVREAKDSTLKNLKDVRAYAMAPVLSSVPLMEEESAVRRRTRLAWLAWTTACLVGAAIMAGSIAYYYLVVRT